MRTAYVDLPGLVTIWLVANDFVGGVSYSAYIHDLNSLLAQLRTNTHAQLANIFWQAILSSR